MKQVLRTIVMLFMVLAVAVSCSIEEPDGLWEKMKWNNLSGLTKKVGIYIVHAKGGTYIFECKNYTPWIDHCDSGSYDVVVSSFKHVYNEWFDVTIDGKKVIVTFQPLEDLTETRQLTVYVTAGDNFDLFRFRQRQ